MIDTLHSIDQSATLFINSFHSSWSDTVNMFFSRPDVWMPMYALCAGYIIYRLGWKRGLVAICAIVLTFAMCDSFSNVVKHAVARLRPCYSIEMVKGNLHVLEKRGGFYGFYSAHSANAFGFAVSALIALRSDKRLKFRGFAFAILSWAALVSLSRIFCGKHYLGDVLVGMLVGCGFGALMGYLARLVISRFMPYKVAPS